MPRQGKYGAKVTYSGPIFEKDVKKTFRQNARVMLLQVAEDGEQLVRSELSAHRGAEAPHISDHIEGRVKSLSGKPWQLTSVVTSQLHMTLPGHKGYMTFLETGMKGARQTTFRGLYVFRRVGSAIKRTRRAQQADLTKGLN